MATSKELNDKIAALEQQLAQTRKEADELRAKERAIIIGQLNQSIAENGIRAEELTFPRAPKTARTQPGKARKGTPGKPKYRDPESGKTWTGHGKRPSWIPDDESQRAAFLIQQ